MKALGFEVQSSAENLTPTISQLFLSFLRLGAVSFGGPAMVAYIRRLAVEQKRWLDDGGFLEGAALCQMIPGATAMQTAAYVGFRTRGLAGAAASYVGFGIPAFLFMMSLAALYTRTHTLPAVVAVFKGLQVVIVAIIANATLSFARTTLKSWNGLVIALIAAILFGCGMNPILVILLASVLGLALKVDAIFQKSASHVPTENSSKKLVIILTITVMLLAILFRARRPLFHLAALMCTVDLFAFGGGFASLPVMFHEVVDVRRWMDASTFLDGIILGQVTPGPIVITATFVGFLLYGPIGGLTATIAVFSPSFLMVIGCAPNFSRLLPWSWFTEATGGVLCSFVGLLLTVTVRFALGVHWDLARCLLVCCSFVALLLKVDLHWVVLAGAIIFLVGI